MAPSRALLRCAAQIRFTSIPQLRSISHQFQNRTTSITPTSPRDPTVPQTPQFRDQTRRLYSSEPTSGPQPPDFLSEGELHVFKKINAELEPVELEVQDISGGCGSMYALDITSPKFKGLSVIKQHKLVNSILKEEIGSWHGVQLKTRAA